MNTSTTVYSQIIPMWTIMTAMEALEDEYSDAFKAAHGFRPRGIPHGCETVAELAALITELYARAVREGAEERMLAEQDAQAFEQRVQNIIAMGAGDRQTALRWIVEGATDANGYFDAESFVYNQYFLFTDYGRELVRELNAL